MLFIGEIREDGAAREALRAAGNGFLVITTSFASDVATAVQSFSDRIEKGQIEMFSQLLRGLLFQRLENKLLQVQLLEKTLVVQQRISQEITQALMKRRNDRQMRDCMHLRLRRLLQFQAVEQSLAPSAVFAYLDCE